MDRRLFATRLTASLGSVWAGRLAFGSDLTKTPSQTRGPYYPIPEIEKQDFFDVDLTRKNDSSPLADGDVIAIRGKVVDMDGRVLEKTLVEVWQACATGRYNHPNDKGSNPLDPNFQYWGRMQTEADGAFAFKTIVPGKYPGRTPHIHFRVVAVNRPALETQIYFDMYEELNRKDGIYQGASPEQQKMVTTSLEKTKVDPKDPKSLVIPTGTIQIVLGPKNDSKSTPGM
ncbi:MAG: protocatechuate 3,4-dioxygenase [Pirellula sp.]